jgi:methyl-accepting chemotaxis protein
MKIRTKIIIGFLALLIPFIISSIINIFQFNKVANYVSNSLPQTFSSLKVSTDLNNLAQFIRYYDEVLTQSARNYVFTGDVSWKDRYNTTNNKLNQTITQALSIGTDADKKLFGEIDSSNKALVSMEEKSFTLVEQNNRQAAINILNSQDYAKQKTIYSQALETYAANQGKGYDDALSASQDALKNVQLQTSDLIRQSIIISLIVALATVIIAAISELILVRSISIPVEKLSAIVGSIANGDLSQTVDISNKDELGKLAKDINTMTTSLKASRENIEKKVAERTAQLEKINKVMVGRELTMIELKNKLLQK